MELTATNQLMNEVKNRLEDQVVLLSGNNEPQFLNKEVEDLMAMFILFIGNQISDQLEKSGISTESLESAKLVQLFESIIENTQLDQNFIFEMLDQFILKLNESY